jgi:hypothetical protein
MKPTIDLSQNRVPWCLLTPDEQNAFVVANHPPKEVNLQVYVKDAWVSILYIVGSSSHQIYRIKPKPREPREFWINVCTVTGAVTRFLDVDAARFAGVYEKEVIHVIEVLQHD